jgi:hypothetical protein
MTAIIIVSPLKATTLNKKTEFYQKNVVYILVHYEFFSPTILKKIV